MYSQWSQKLCIPSISQRDSGDTSDASIIFSLQYFGAGDTIFYTRQKLNLKDLSVVTLTTTVLDDDNGVATDGFRYIVHTVDDNSLTVMSYPDVIAADGSDSVSVHVVPTSDVNLSARCDAIAFHRSYWWLGLNDGVIRRSSSPFGPFDLVVGTTFQEVNCIEPSIDGKSIFFGGQNGDDFPAVAKYTYDSATWTSSVLLNTEGTVRSIKAVSAFLYAASVEIYNIPEHSPFISADGQVWIPGSTPQSGDLGANSNGVLLATNRCGVFMQGTRFDGNSETVAPVAQVLITQDYGQSYQQAIVQDPDFAPKCSELALIFAGFNTYVLIYELSLQLQANQGVLLDDRFIVKIAISRDGGVTFVPTGLSFNAKFEEPSATLHLR